MSNAEAPKAAILALPIPADLNRFERRVYTMALRDAAAVVCAPSGAVTADQGAGWISVDDRLPAYNVPVLAWNGALAVFRLDCDYDGWRWVCQTFASDLTDADGFEWDDDYEVTHWMALPNPPALRADAPEASK